MRRILDLALSCTCRDQAYSGTLFGVFTLLYMAASSDAAGGSQVTLQHLSDAELANILSCLGRVYRLSGAAEAPNTGAGFLPLLASVDRRFRALVHTQVAEKVVIDSPVGFTFPEDCPCAADDLIRHCKEIYISAAAAADLCNQKTFTDLLRVKACSLVSLSIGGGRLRRSQLHVLCAAPWCAPMLNLLHRPTTNTG